MINFQPRSKNDFAFSAPHILNLEREIIRGFGYASETRSTKIQFLAFMNCVRSDENIAYFTEVCKCTFLTAFSDLYALLGKNPVDERM